MLIPLDATVSTAMLSQLQLILFLQQLLQQLVFVLHLIVPVEFFNHWWVSRDGSGGSQYSLRRDLCGLCVALRPLVRPHPPPSPQGAVDQTQWSALGHFWNSLNIIVLVLCINISLIYSKCNPIGFATYCNFCFSTAKCGRIQLLYKYKLLFVKSKSIFVASRLPMRKQW